MRLVFGALGIASALAACSYEFGGAGGTSSPGGAGGATASSTTGDPSTTTTATTDASSSSTGTLDVSTASATSSSTGIVEPMDACKDAQDSPFFDDFSVDGDPSWAADPPTPEGLIQGGRAHLKLATLPKLWLRSTRGVKFTECSMAVQLAKPSQQYDGVRLEREAGSFLGVYRGVDKWVPYSQVAYGGVSASPEEIPYGQWIRFRAEGAMVFVESGTDGMTYPNVASYLRAQLPFLEQDVTFTFTLEKGTGLDDVAEWDHLNTLP